MALSAALERMVVSPQEQRERTRALKQKFRPVAEAPPTVPLVVKPKLLPQVKPPKLILYRLSYSIAPDAWHLCFGPQMPKAPEIVDIVVAVGKYFSVPFDEMISRRRPVYITTARFVSFLLSKELTPHTLAAIGRHIGGRDHTTIMSGIHKITIRLRSDAELRKDVEQIRAKLLGYGAQHATD